MAVTTDIVESWWRPGRVVRRHLLRGQSEAFAFTLLLAFLVLAFIAQWPEVARVAAKQPDTPMTVQLVGRAMALLASIPVWYGLAALARLLAKALGGQGTWYSARIALFCALLSAAPFALFHGLLRGIIGEGTQATAVGLLVLAAFLYLWLAMMIEAER